MSKMKFEYVDSLNGSPLTFRYLNVGDVFLSYDNCGHYKDNELWVKTSHYHNDPEMGFAVDVLDGGEGLFKNDDRVRLVEAKVMVKL